MNSLSISIDPQSKFVLCYELIPDSVPGEKTIWMLKAMHWGAQIPRNVHFFNENFVTFLFWNGPPCILIEIRVIYCACFKDSLQAAPNAFLED